jgi:hypothetical protein
MLKGPAHLNAFIYNVRPMWYKYRKDVCHTDRIIQKATTITYYDTRMKSEADSPPCNKLSQSPP